MRASSSDQLNLFFVPGSTIVGIPVHEDQYRVVLSSPAVVEHVAQEVGPPRVACKAIAFIGPTLNMYKSGLRFTSVTSDQEVVGAYRAFLTARSTQPPAEPVDAATPAPQP